MAKPSKLKIEPLFLKNLEKTRYKIKILYYIASFDQIYPKEALKYTIFLKIQKGQKKFLLANRFKKGQMTTMCFRAC